MEKLRELFGGGALTWEELTAALEKRGDIALADISTGDYVERGRYDEDVGAARLGGAVELALMSAGARNVKTARAALDMSALRLDGDTVTGLAEQIEGLKRTDGYLFREAADGARLDTGGGHGGAGGVDTASMSDAEYYASRLGKH